MITVKTTKSNTLSFYSSHPFFIENEELTFFVDEFGFGFKVPSIDNARSYKRIKVNKEKASIFIVKTLEIPDGRYSVNTDESNEDQIVFDF
jgi:hypothetical protein